MIAGRHGEKRHVLGGDYDRLAGVGVEHVGEHLLQFVDVGPIDQIAACPRIDPRRRGLVGVERGAVFLVVVDDACDDLGNALLFVDAQGFADFGRVLQDHVGAVEEDRFLGHRHDETALRGARRFDVPFAEAGVGVRHAGGDGPDGVGIERLHAGDLLAVEFGGFVSISRERAKAGEL